MPIPLDWSNTQPAYSSLLDSDPDSGSEFDDQHTPTKNNRIVSPDVGPNKHRRRSLSDAGPSHRYSEPRTPSNRKKTRVATEVPESPLLAARASPSPPTPPRSPSQTPSVLTMADMQTSPVQGPNQHVPDIPAAPTEPVFTLGGIALPNIMVELPDIGTWAAVGAINQQRSPSGDANPINWQTQLTDEQRNALAGYLRLSAEQIPFGARDIETKQSLKYRKCRYIEQNAGRVVLVNGALGGSLLTEALSTRLIAQIMEVTAALGATPQQVDIIVPEPASRAMAATNKNASPGAFIVTIDNHAARALFVQQQIWSKDQELTFLTRAADSGQRSWIVGVYEARCGNMPLAHIVSLFRWLVMVNLTQDPATRSFVHTATPNDTRPLTHRTVEYAASFDVRLVDPHPPPPGQPIRLALTVPPLNNVDYETQKEANHGIRNKDFVWEANSFTLSQRYLPDRRALHCYTCGLDWHVNAECPLHSVPDYGGPRGTISELVDQLCGQGVATAAWQRIRNRAGLPDLEPHPGDESDEYTPPTRGQGHAHRGTRGGGARARGRGRGRGRGVRGRGRGF
ncbi:hypothetical protein AAF712_016558 [Marasmius tenuissimus]|uniref:Uncharacterized protein n=1 Tax=Marasmius tenuissimus TaxID=585030 RepID=A0ABR2Z760_9AGAR